MATTQHYLWASGHFILLLSAIRYFFSYATFKNVSPVWYKACYTGAILSYAIVCHKSLGLPQPNMAYARKALLDENVQYFILAFFWWTSKPIATTADGPPTPHPLGQTTSSLGKRWYQSNFTREAVAVSTARIEATVTGQGNPTLTNVWMQAKGLVVRWGGSSLAPPQAARAQPAR
ncbi:hypothetical protein BT96DRAFT_930776 [Gymnopus androsaceus JB14]|uniref:Uncharacterized protein n=1 Tax=Gymnopus androsaceus JB14 TaxID=1447944 RepID=A0A6A4IMU5_9AGAR|nr:hypothetical protein BT96DRAFT_930776 [Gymnopus androsaceus JB14]